VLESDDSFSLSEGGSPMTRRTRLFAAAVAAPLLFVGTPPAGADPGSLSHVDSLTATVAGSAIQITGAATFVDVPVTVATDAANDSALNGFATDLVKGTIARPDPARSELRFTLEISDPVSTTHGVPEVVHYSYFLSAGPNPNDGWLLLAARTAQLNATGSTSPMFRLDRFRADGTCCDIVSQLSGSMADGKISFTVPFGPLGLSPGKAIEAHSRLVQVQLGASGFSRLNNGQPDFMSVEETYTVPGPQVRLGIAPAGVMSRDIVHRCLGTSFHLSPPAGSPGWDPRRAS
jgi:hypothetical protein